MKIEKVVYGLQDMPDTDIGITPGKQYAVTYECKDEVGVINDFGEEAEYCFCTLSEPKYAMQIDDEELLSLGIEIVSAMKASSYGVDIEEGRLLALDGTEVDKTEYSTEELTKHMEEIKKMCEHEKLILHRQAMFVAKAAIAKINHI